MADWSGGASPLPVRPVGRMADVRFIFQVREHGAAQCVDIELALLLIDHPATRRDRHGVGTAASQCGSKAACKA